MSGGKLHGESFCIAGCFSDRLVFLLKFLLKEGWPRVLRWKRQRGRTHYSHVGLFCLCRSSREPFSPPAQHVSTESNAAHKMPVRIQMKAFCFNKEKQNRAHVGSVCLKDTEHHNAWGFLRQHSQEHLKNNNPYCPQTLGSTLHRLCNKLSYHNDKIGRLSVSFKVIQITSNLPPLWLRSD